jgi:3',5'-cyclic AMP phosphodiesterase CpdA
MNTVRLAHISDLHCSEKYHPGSIRRAEFLIETLLERGFDHLVVTGDLTANGESHEFQSVRALFRKYDVLDTRRLSVVIGNHDIFGGVHEVNDILRFPGRCRRTDYRGKVEMFRRYFAEAFEGCILGSREHGFPFAKIVKNVLLVGLNSIAPYSRLKNPFGSNGSVGNSQFRRVKNLLAVESFLKMDKIILLHHHFSPGRRAAGGTLEEVWNTLEQESLRLRGKRKLAAMFNRHGASLILHGHVHENREYVRHGIRCINGGGSLLNDTAALQANMITIGVCGVQVDSLHVIPPLRRMPLPPSVSVHSAA